VKRLMERDGYNLDEATRRVNAQMPLEEKVRRAHRVLDNTGTIEETKRQVDELFEGVMQTIQKSERVKNWSGGRFDE
jgi:dephospho-CoA kinase